MVEPVQATRSEFAQRATRTFERLQPPEQIEGDPSGSPFVINPAAVAAKGNMPSPPEQVSAPPPPEPIDTSFDPQFLTDYEAGGNLRNLALTIYGEVPIAEALRLRSGGGLAEAVAQPGYFKVKPEISRLMSASGATERQIGWYLLSRGNTSRRNQFVEIYGEPVANAIEQALRKPVDTEATPKRNGILGGAAAVGSDVLDFALNDLVDTIAAGAISGATSLIQSTESLALFASGTKELKVFQDTRITPKSEAEIEFLRGLETPRTIGGKRDTRKDKYALGQALTIDLSRSDYLEFMDTFRPDETPMDNSQLVTDWERLEQEANSHIDTVTGQIGAGIVEFGTTFMVSPSFLKASKWYTQIVNGAVKGAVADNIIYDLGDESVASMLDEYNVPGNELLTLLRTEEDDGVFETRAKIMIEGMIIGGSADGLLHLLKGIRKSAKGDLKGAAEELQKAAEAELTDAQKRAKVYLEKREAAKAETEAKKAEAKVAEGKESDEAAAAVDAAEPGVSGTRTTTRIEFERDKLPDLSDADVENINLTDDFINRGTESGIDSSFLTRIFGENWVDGMLEDAAENLELFQARLFKSIEAINNPVAFDELRAGAAYVFQTVMDADGLDPSQFNKIVRSDPADWSTSDSVNVLAAGMFQQAFTYELQRVVKQIVEFGPATTEASAKQLADLQKRADALKGQLEILAVGKAKMGRNNALALLAFKAEKKATSQRDREIAHARWAKARNLIDAKEEARLIDMALSRAADAKAKAAVARTSARMRKSPIEKFLIWTNANLLANFDTQSLMLISNILRTVNIPLIRFVEGAIDITMSAPRSLASVMTGQGLTTQSKQGLQKLAQSAFYLSATARAMPKAFASGWRFWKTGLSEFNKRTMFDEEGTFAGKSLAEVRSEPAVGGDKPSLQNKAVKAAEHLYRFMGAIDEGFKEIIMTADMQVRARAGEYGEELQAISKVGLPTDAQLREYLSGDTKSDFIDQQRVAKGGRVLDKSSIDLALTSLFQQEAVDGTLNANLNRMFGRQPARTLEEAAKNRTASAIARLLLMRFVSTPLNVMEERFATYLAPLLLANASGVRGLGSEATLKFLAGKFLTDLKSTDPRVASRARAAIVLNSIFFTTGLMQGYALYDSGEEPVVDVELDPKHPQYGKLRIDRGNGYRYVNVMDMEMPYANAYLFGRMAMHIGRRNADPKEALEFSDGMGMLSALFINQTLEKSSLKNITDTISAIVDDKQKGLGRVLVSQVSTAVPLNRLVRSMLMFGNQGEFDGKPTSFLKVMAKQVPVLKPLIGGIMNSERNALGELTPSNSRGLNPFVSRFFKTDDVLEEMARISLSTGVRFDRAVMQTGDVPLHEWETYPGSNQSVFDLMQQAISDGDVKINGRTLREELALQVSAPSYQEVKTEWASIIDQRGYDQQGRKRIVVGGDDVKHPGIKLFRTVLRNYRKEALAHIMRSDKYLPQETKEALIASINFRSGFTIEDINLEDNE